MPRIAKRTRVTGTLSLVGLSLAALALFSTRASAGQNLDGRIQQRIGRLEAAVQAEEGLRAVKRLQHTYSHYLESGLWADLGDLFTDNAAGQFQSATVTGKDNLRKYFMEEAGRTELGLAQGQLHAHLILQPIVTLGADGKTAKGTWHEVALLGKFGASASWAGGIYENEYVFDKGVWKISKLSFYPQYQGEYEDFGHKAPAQWGIPYHFEAAHVGLTIPPSALQALTPSSPPSADAVRSRLAQLAERAQRMNDETQVQNLQHSYGYYMDRKLWDDMADLFTEDGSLEIGQRGVYESRPHIRRALEVLYGASPLRTGEMFDHINLAAVVTIAADGRSARARASQLSMLGLNGQGARWEEGVYENEFVKQDGAWKMKTVRYFPRMAADYEKGWARDAIPAAAASAEFPPDRKPSQSYQSYPAANYVALHFANPVTGRTVQYPSTGVTAIPVIKAPESSGRTPIANANIETVLAETERQVDSAIAVDAVENLNSSYGYYLDESAWDDMAATFAVAKGSKEITGVGVYVGRDRIRTVLNLRGPRGGRSATTFTIHQLTQPVIHISEDGSSAKARLRLFQLGGAANGSSGSWIGGIYENTAFKEDGEWKFGAQDLHHIFNAAYRNGWARMGAAARGNAPAPARGGAQPAAPRGAAPAAPRGNAAPVPARGGGGLQQGIGGAASPNQFAATFPPDRAIRSRQYAFPEIVEPAFHYKNPVSGRMPKELLP